MSIKKNKNSMIKPGFTLIELIATMAILSIAIAMAFSISSFGYTSFKHGDTKSDLQTNLRSATDYITKQMRYSSNVVIFSSKPDISDIADTTTNGKEYIYYDSNGVLMHCAGGISSKIMGATSSKIAATLQFKKNDLETLFFKLVGQASTSSETYTINSSTVILNLGDKFISGADTGEAVCYTPGESMDTNINSKPVTSITITAPSNLIGVNGGTLQLTSTVLPTDASVKNVTWSVDNPLIAIIDPVSGLLKTTTSTKDLNILVKATANDGSGVSTTYSVKTAILANVQVTSVTVTSAFNYVISNGGNLQMIGNVLPTTASNGALGWSLEPLSTLATINSSNGLLTTANTNSVGSVIVKAVAMDGSNKFGNKTITVIPKITSTSISGGTSIGNNNGSLTLSCNVLPSGAALGISNVSWTVTGDSNASITNSGVLKTDNGNKKVTASSLTVTATVLIIDGSVYKPSIIIIVGK